MTNKIETVRTILRKYIADDGLRPEYDGKTAWSVAEEIVKAVEETEVPINKMHDHTETCRLCPQRDDN